MPVETSTSEPVESAPVDVIATVALEHGGVATFLDLGDGQIGITERAPAQGPILAVPRAAANSLADWKAAFVGVTKYREALYRHNQPDPFKFYPGANAYYHNNTNSITHLGACNGDEDDALAVSRTAGRAAPSSTTAWERHGRSRRL